MLDYFIIKVKRRLKEIILVPDVATGISPTQASTAAMDQSVASNTKLKKQDQGNSPRKPSAPISSTETTNSGVNSLLRSEASDNSQTVNTKHGSSLVQNVPVSASRSRINNLNESTSGTRVSEKLESVNNNIAVSIAPSMPRLQCHTTLGQSNVLERGKTENVIRSVSRCVISVPPGFQNLAHDQHSVQEQSFSKNMKTGTHGQNSFSCITKQHVPNNSTTSNHTVSVSRSVQPQEKKQVQQNMHIREQEQLHSHQTLEPDRQPMFWQNASVSQQLHLNSKAQKQEGDNCKKYQITTTASSQNSQSHQQQYPYSISPAALFHMASQASRGQMSAVVLPSATESNASSRPGLPASTTTAVGTTGSGAPPGFSAALPINYHGQHIDALSMNKLLIGSSVFRTSVTQADVQSVTPSTAQPFLSVNGPMPGIYVSAHTPHSYSNPSLNQRHPVFDTRHFISQQVTQGLHQNVAQGLPQAMTGSVPPGMQPGTSVSLPPPGLPAPLSQGISNSVPQAVPQGMHQNIQSGISPVNCSAVSQGMPAVPIGHPFPPQHNYPQQGFQVSLYFHSMFCMYFCMNIIV